MDSRSAIPRTHILEGVCKIESTCFAYGGLADIYRGQWAQKPGNEPIPVAIKLLRRHGCDGQAAVKRAHECLARESNLWSRLLHPYITPFYGLVFEQDRPGLVMPYYENGDLVYFLKRNPQANRLDLICEAVAGLEYLHNLKPDAVIHGDIKPYNILVTNNGQACLADFGTSRMISFPTSSSSQPVGTCRWMAPELLRHSDAKPTTASDVWAFGMTILQVLTDRIPFDHIKSDPPVILSVALGNLPPCPPEIDEATWALLNRCWSSNPSKRPRAETVSIIVNIMAYQEISPDIVNDLVHYMGAQSLYSERVGSRKRSLFDYEWTLPWKTYTITDAMSLVKKVLLVVGNARSSNVFSGQLTAKVQPRGAHEDLTIYDFPCYWPECEVRLNALVARRAHLVQHWHRWMAKPVIRTRLLLGSEGVILDRWLQLKGAEVLSALESLPSKVMKDGKVLPEGRPQQAEHSGIDSAFKDEGSNVQGEKTKRDVIYIDCNGEICQPSGFCKGIKQYSQALLSGVRGVRGTYSHRYNVDGLR